MEKAIEIDSEDADAYYNLGFIYHTKGDVDHALIYFKKAAKLGDLEIQNWLKENGHTW